MIVALLVVQVGVDRLFAIVLGQAVTVLASPLLALTIIWLSNRKDVMGDDRPAWWMNALAWIGFLLLLVVVYYLATRAYGTFTTQLLPKLRGG